jgi:hypothetical protein
MSQLIGAASNYEEVIFDVRIPSLTDTANIVEAFKAYHFGLDNFQGDVEPAANSIHSWLKDFDERIETVEASTTITLTGTANEVNVSASVGNITVGLPDDVTVGRDLTVTRDLFVSDDLQVSDNLTVLGTSIFSSTASAMSTLRVNGATTLDSTLAVGSNLDVSGSASIPTLSSTTASVTTDYVTTSNITTGNITTANVTDLNVTGTLNIQEVTEFVADYTITSSSTTLAYSTSNIFYNSASPSSNFFVDITGVPTTNDRTIVVSLIVTQGSTGRIPNELAIDGTLQTIKWAGGAQPTPTSVSGRLDIFNFTLIRKSSSWIVIGSANLNFG